MNDQEIKKWIFKKYIKENKSAQEVANELGIGRTTLYRRLKEYELDNVKGIIYTGAYKKLKSKAERGELKTHEKQALEYMQNKIRFRIRRWEEIIFGEKTPQQKWNKATSQYNKKWRKRKFNKLMVKYNVTKADLTVLKKNIEKGGFEEIPWVTFVRHLYRKYDVEKYNLLFKELDEETYEEREERKRLYPPRPNVESVIDSRYPNKVFSYSEYLELINKNMGKRLTDRLIEEI